MTFTLFIICSYKDDRFLLCLSPEIRSVMPYLVSEYLGTALPHSRFSQRENQRSEFQNLPVYQYERALLSRIVTKL